MSSRLLSILFPVLLALTFACSGPPPRSSDAPLPERIMPSEVIPTGPHVERSSDGLVRVETQPGIRARIYVKPPRPHLQRYDRMLLAPVVVDYKDGVDRWGPKEESVLQEAFQRYVLDSIDSGPGWARVEHGGEGVLIVRVSLREVDLGRTPDVSASKIDARPSRVSAVMMLELLDSTTREPLLRYVERRSPGGVHAGSVELERVRIREVFYDFAEAVGDLLSTQYRIVKEIERREAEDASR